MSERHEHWRVSVETSGEQIVAIEPEMLAGREISEADEDAIRTAAHHLLAFIGDPSSQTNLVGMEDEDRTPVPEGFDAAQWQKADEVFHATALVANDIECVKIIYAALYRTNHLLLDALKAIDADICMASAHPDNLRLVRAALTTEGQP